MQYGNWTSRGISLRPRLRATANTQTPRCASAHHSDPMMTNLVAPRRMMAFVTFFFVSYVHENRAQETYTPQVPYCTAEPGGHTSSDTQTHRHTKMSSSAADAARLPPATSSGALTTATPFEDLLRYLGLRTGSHAGGRSRRQTMHEDVCALRQLLHLPVARDCCLP